MFKNKKNIEELKETFSTNIKETQYSLQESLTNLNEKIKQLGQEMGTSSKLSKYTLLNSNEKAQYLMPLDQEPSTSYYPRFGYTHPVLAPIEKLLKKQKESYKEIVVGLLGDLPQLQKFPLQFSETHLPNPGLLDGNLTVLDLCLLYSLVASKKPKHYLEVGSGLSTCVVHQAIKDHHLKTEIISIDAHLKPKLKEITTKSIEKPLEEADLSVFSNLGENDIVYFNSSHRSFMNSDVTVFMLEVLPLLKPGVLIQMKDIYLPFDYPTHLKTQYWNEQYLLATYLNACPEKIKPIFPGHYVCKTCPDLNKELKYFLLELKDRVKSTALEATPSSDSFWFTHL